MRVARDYPLDRMTDKRTGRWPSRIVYWPIMYWPIMYWPIMCQPIMCGLYFSSIYCVVLVFERRPNFRPQHINWGQTLLGAEMPIRPTVARWSILQLGTDLVYRASHLACD